VSDGRKEDAKQTQENSNGAGYGNTELNDTQ